MKRRLFVVTTSTLALGAAMTAAYALDSRSGRSAFGDWHIDNPGLIRKILPEDIAAPLETPSDANRSKVVPKPADASLKTMAGFTVVPFATGMTGARVMRMAPNGDIFLSRSRPDGAITILRPSKAGDKAEKIETFTSGLKDPYGIAFYPPGPDPKWVYIGMEGKVVRFPFKLGDLKPSGPMETIVTDLAVPGGGHWTRDVSFSPDGKVMYVAVGSGSNVADSMGPQPADLAQWEKTHSLGSAWDKEEWRANVLTYTPDGKNKSVYAAGIRNCSGLTVQPGTGTVYCSTNERDRLGDNTPPDYITSVKKGAFYGWPWYYIGAHEDSRPGGGPRPDLKNKVTPPDVLLQSHSAPLGMSFNPGGNFPAEWKGDGFAALHGSWNRSLHTGYKIVRLPFKNGKPTGEYQDFVLGFTAGEENVWGRPVDVAFAKDGSMLFSEDGNGVVYRVTYSKPSLAAK